MKAGAASPDDGSDGRPGYPIGSVDNALRLLLAFRDQSRLRLSDASALLGVAHSTAHRLLAMLAYHGFVRQDPDTRAYEAGPALLEVGLAVVRRMDLRSIVHPVLTELQRRFSETAHLAVLEGREVRYLDSVESDRALRVVSRTGTRLPAHCTSVGKALLAALPAEQFAALYASDADLLPAATHNSITSLERLSAQLAEVRRRGYATNKEESEDGVGSVAVTMTGAQSEGIAAISVAAPLTRLSASRIRQIAPVLTEFAAAAGADLRR
jgi:DNA-binding IclR family transcriptional regulator